MDILKHKNLSIVKLTNRQKASGDNKLFKELPYWFQEAETKDAVCSLSMHFQWHDGTWINGEWLGCKGCKWLNGTWLDGTWHNGIWDNGIWLNGIWVAGDHKKGIWVKGYYRKKLCLGFNKKGKPIFAKDF